MPFRFSTAAAGGRLMVGPLELEWGNTVVPGCQLMGAPSWGWTTISWGPCSWFLG